MKLISENKWIDNEDAREFLLETLKTRCVTTSVSPSDKLVVVMRHQFRAQLDSQIYKLRKKRNVVCVGEHTIVHPGFTCLEKT